MPGSLIAAAPALLIVVGNSVAAVFPLDAPSACLDVPRGVAISVTGSASDRDGSPAGTPCRRF